MRPFDNLDELQQVLQLAISDMASAEQRLRMMRPGGGSESQVRIYYGPPGTGKTLAAVAEAVKLADPTFSATAPPAEAFRRMAELRDQIAFVTFHPSLQYEDMVEGIRPVVVPPDATASGSADEIEDFEDGDEDASESVAGSLEYRLWEGPLLRLIRNAQRDESREYVVVIDEINRGDVSRILGPLISAIEPDKRADREYPIGFEALYPLDAASESRIFIPSNLHILGTMNSADRNIALVDYALRRRFEFVPLPPDSSLLQRSSGEEIDLRKLLETINRRISFLLDSDHMIGHGYLMSCKSQTDIVEVVATKIVPLLHEYFFGNEAEILLVLGERIDNEYSIHEVVQESSDFEQLFGLPATEAAVLGYRSSARRMSLSISPRFWDSRQSPGRPGDVDFAVQAVKSIYGPPQVPVTDPGRRRDVGSPQTDNQDAMGTVDPAASANPDRDPG